MSEETRTPRLGSRQVGRRDLLKIGATGAVLPAMIGPAAVNDKLTATNTDDEPGTRSVSGPLSIGYWGGEPDTIMVNARELSSGERALADSGAEIQMVGMGQALGDSASHLQSMAVDLQIGQATFKAWRYDNTLVRNISSPAAFSVPVDGKQGLSFSVSAVHGKLSSIIRAGGFSLSTGKSAAVPKLRSGYYVLALGENGRKPRINWAGYDIAGDSTGQSFYLRKNGTAVSSFPYLIFTIAPKRPVSTNYV